MTPTHGPIDPQRDEDDTTVHEGEIVDEKQERIKSALDGSGTRLLGGHGGRGDVTFESDMEQAQTDSLAAQMMRATSRQLQIASERISRVRWLETHGSKEQGDDSHLIITEFEMILSNGLHVKIVGPVMDLEFSW